MVKCLIRIKTKVNIHLRMINHCYRDVKVRVLTMGPRLLGNVLGALPIIPALPESSSSSGIGLSPYGRSHRAPGSVYLSVVTKLVMCRMMLIAQDAVHSAKAASPLRSPLAAVPFVVQLENLTNSPYVIGELDDFMNEQGHRNSYDFLGVTSLSMPEHSVSSPEGKNGEADFSEGSYKPTSDELPTLELKSTHDQEVRDPESVSPAGGPLAHSSSQKPSGTASQLEKTKVRASVMESHKAGKLISMLARLVLVTLALLLALLLLLIALTESKLDVPFLRDIRETPEFQQLHYTYFCPLRRSLTCSLRWIGIHLIKE